MPEESPAVVPLLPTFRRLQARLHETSQIALLFLYLIAVMTPQVRRALSALDRV